MQKYTLAVLFLAACGTTTNTTSDAGNTNDGGTTDYAAPYEGNWSGSVTVTANGQMETTNGVLAIQETAINVIQIQGFCSDTDVYAAGPVADVTASGFTVRADSCTFSSTSCNAGDLTFAWSDGSGSLSNGQVGGSVDGTLTCGTDAIAYSLTFTATGKQAYGGVRGIPRAEAPALLLHLFQR